MATFSGRLPSKENARLMFGSCVFLFHVWTVLTFLTGVPSLVLRMHPWDVLAAGAYTLTFALLESLGLFLGE